MKEVSLKLSIDEANAVLNALGNLPFVQVNQLISKIQLQAGQQLNGNGSGSGEGSSQKKEKVK
ncbi:MAG: hypothetical protein ABJF04_21675 [Reichenbachiella sp.]|uniref:hypothetical protein n=1 Tax=Reichenbachiella sp. TaxID=2184521 RepID=UPI0032666B5A